MRTIEKVIYQLSELSEQAKEKAYSRWLEHSDDPYASDNEATLNAFCKIFPVTNLDWSYDSCNGHISFRMNTDYVEIDEMTGNRLLAYLWNNYSSDLFKGKYYSVKSNKKLRHNRIVSKDCRNGNIFNAYYSAIQKDNSCVLTGYYADEDILEPIYKFLEKPTSSTFEELLDECLNAWIKACVDEQEYCESFEYFEETCEANDYEFDEFGNMI